MTFGDLQKISKKLYSPAFAVEDICPRYKRKKIEKIVGGLTAFLVVVSVFVFVINHYLQILPADFPSNKLYGLSAIALALWLTVFALQSFFYSYFYNTTVKKGLPHVDFDLAYAIYKTSEKDILAGFFETPYGQTFILRCGITPLKFEKFLSDRKIILDGMHFKCDIVGDKLTAEDLVGFIFEQDEAFKELLFQNGIQKKEVMAIADWMVESAEAKHEEEHWWGEENLRRMTGIGRAWSYGQIFLLEKFERTIPFHGRARYEIHSSYGVDELQEIEAVLSRKREANALLIGNDEAGRMSIISHLSEMIEEDTSVVELSHKRIVVFDSDAFTSQNDTKPEFERNFTAILDEASRAGNIVLVIENFPAFISSASVFGADLPSFLSPYLKSSNLQIIAMSDIEHFHSILEPNSAIMQHFEKIFIKDIDQSNTIKVLENELESFERQGFFFTYQAIIAIVESAERYFSDGVMPDKAIDLLLEITPKLRTEGKFFVEKSDVLELVQFKTGIPTGEVGKDERMKLLNLERVLHERIVGQDEAIEAISNAVRRARSGVENPDRPMGSFLFLGPTGVGKTETTKALAQVFFGSETGIMRLDMSEYSSYDSVSKLIGSFEGKQSGILSSLLREHPYGVLLLDEFEKTTKEVMNLFLQILDEGFFSDMSGKKVNARNLIIIATSNAGSDMIWQAVKEDKSLVEEKDKIIESLISSGVFKPELLNRFDGVIMFHPLTDENLRKIAELQLGKLQRRLAGKGMNLIINSDLVDFLVSKGTDPKFGARPLNRAIEGTIEQIISKKIIAGSISPGVKITLTADELTK